MLDEIARWSAMSDEDRLKVIALLPERHKQMEKKETR